LTYDLEINKACWLSSYIFVENFIKLSVEVHQLRY